MANENESSKIVEFFHDSTVFLTGGTGFIGKVIINKLFSTCKVSCVYLLIRKKSSMSSAERLRKLFESEVFLHLKNDIPNFEDRIKLVEGDCSLENLGISTQDEKTLCTSVDFVIHGAAAMNMLGSFKTSVEINIQGTKNLVILANKFMKLKTFVYLSTLAAQWDNVIIDEKLYESHLEYEDCLNLLKIDHVLPMDKHELKRITGKKITYYAMTKAAAENIFARERISVPVVIFRFGLVLPCWKEPTPGWIEEFYGPNGMFAAALLNVDPVFYWNSDMFDFCPADLVVNALLAATHHSYDQFHRNKTNNEKILPFVYNHSCKKHEHFLPLEDCLAYLNRELNINVVTYSNKAMFILWSIMFAYIPAILFDCFAPLIGKKLRIFQFCKNLIDLNLKVSRTNVGFQVNNENLQICWRSLNEVDKRLFSFDLKEVVWGEYLSNSGIYIRNYLRKLLETNEKIRLAVFWIPKTRFAFKMIYFILGLYFVSSIYSWLH